MSARTFTWDGETYDVVPVDDWNFQEGVAIEEWAARAGYDWDALVKTKLLLGQALAWATLHRRRPDFTLEDAAKLKISIVNEIRAAAARAVPSDHQAPAVAGVVLSPTSGEPDAKPNRAARRSPTKRAATARTSRTSSGSVRGKSVS